MLDVARRKSGNATVRVRHGWSIHSLIQKCGLCFIYSETMLFSNMKGDLLHVYNEHAAVSCSFYLHTL